EDYGNFDENFPIIYKDDNRSKIELKATLHQMPANLVIQIAIYLGIDTPGFLPAIPTFKNVLKDQNQSAYQNFDRATKNVYEHPDLSVGLASSTLEGIIKTILSCDRFQNMAEEIKNMSLSKLIATIVKEFGFSDKTHCPREVVVL